MTTALSNDRPAVAAPSRVRLWAGRVLSVLPALMLLSSVAMKLSHAPSFVAAWTDHLGWRESALSAIGVLELACTVLYIVPRTATIGAILLTAYLGGAVATHVRVGDPFAIPVVLGVMVWLGLWLRDESLRRIAPLRFAGAAR